MTAIIPTSNHSAKLVKKAFGIDGVLAKAISGFSPRQAQTDMAIDVADAIDNQSSLIVEAGTGTGKTFAYLIPAFLSLDPKKTLKNYGFNGNKEPARAAFSQRYSTY
jgi:ATP-dependent DNA helicase DinG